MSFLIRLPGWRLQCTKMKTFFFEIHGETPVARIKAESDTCTNRASRTRGWKKEAQACRWLYRRNLPITVGFS